MVELRHLRKSFGPKVVLKDVNLKVPKGSTTVILGLSGQGKSTIINAISNTKAKTADYEFTTLVPNL